MPVTMPAPITRMLTVPTALAPTEAIARLRAADEAARANPHWLVPTDLLVTWQETGGTIAGIAFGFAVEGTIAAEDGAVTVTLTVPWTGKALLGAFLTRLEGTLQAILA